MDYKDSYKLSQELDSFKRKDLSAFIASHGWAIDKNGSTQLYSVLRKDDDKLVVHLEPNGHYVYCNAHNTMDSGTIIDFTQKYILDKNNLGEVRSYIRSHAGLVPAPASIKISEKPVISDILDHYKLSEFNDTKYLNSRGISNETLKNPIFNKCIFNRQYVSSDAKVFINTVFPMFNRKQIVALEQKNFNLHKPSLAGSQKSIGLWRSNIFPDKPVSKVTITEAPIDAISYFELTPFKKENNLLLSTCGSPTQQQYLLLSEILTENKYFKNASLNVGFDNDKSGMMFSVQLLGQLQNPEFFCSEKFINEKPHLAYATFASYIDQTSKKGIVSISMSCANMEQGILVLKDVEKKMQDYNKENKFVTVENNAFDFKFKVLKDNKVTGEIQFPNVLEHWGIMCNMVKELKYDNSPKLQFERAVNKDFNEDLQVLKGLRKGEGLGKRYSYNIDQSATIKNCTVDITQNNDKVTFKTILNSNSKQALSDMELFVKQRINDFNSDCPASPFTFYNKKENQYALILSTSTNDKIHNEFFKQIIDSIKEKGFDVTINNTISPNLSITEQPNKTLKM